MQGACVPKEEASSGQRKCLSAGTGPSSSLAGQKHLAVQDPPTRQGTAVWHRWERTQKDFPHVANLGQAGWTTEPLRKSEVQLL